MKKYLLSFVLLPFFFKAQVSPHYFNLFKSTTAYWGPNDNIRLANGNKVVSATFQYSSGISTGGGMVTNFNGPNSVLWTKAVDQPYNLTNLCENGTGIYSFFNGSHVAPGIIKLNATNGNTVWTKAFNNTANPLYSATSQPQNVMIMKENANIAVSFCRTDTGGVGHSFLMKMDANGNVLFSKRIDSINVYDVVKAGTNYILLGSNTYPGPTYLISVDGSYNINWSKKINYAQSASPYMLSFQNNTIYAAGAQGNNAILQAFSTSGNLLWSKSYYPASPSVNALSGLSVTYKSNHLHMITNIQTPGAYYVGLLTTDMNGGVLKERNIKYGTNVQVAWDRVGLAPSDTAIFISGVADMSGTLNGFQTQFDPEGDLEMCVPDSIGIADSSLTSVVSAGPAYLYVNDATSFSNTTLPALAESVVTQGFQTTVDSIVPSPAPCAQACSGMMTVYYSGVDGNPAIQWSANTGNQTSQVATNLCPGTYSVSLTDMFGCSSLGNAGILGSALPLQPDICMVTVDSIGTTNYIFWDKTNYSHSDTFIVYRDTANNNYARIGKVPFDSLSQFADTVRTLYAANGDPNVTSWRYKIAVHDSCGNYSQMSLYHQTMFIQHNLANFNWTPYEIEGQPLPVPALSNYLFKRDDLSMGVWNTIQTLSASSLLYTDPGYAGFASTASWRTETQWTVSCNPTYKVAPGTFAAVKKSRSNVQNNMAALGMNSVSEKDFAVMPNPASDLFIVQSKFTVKNFLVEVYDFMGRKVLSEKSTSNENKTTVNVTTLANGIYSVRIISDNCKTVKKLVIEK